MISQQCSSPSNFISQLLLLPPESILYVVARLISQRLDHVILISKTFLWPLVSLKINSEVLTTVRW